MQCEKGVSTKFELIVLLSACVISVWHRLVENPSSVRTSIKYLKISQNLQDSHLLKNYCALVTVFVERKGRKCRPHALLSLLSVPIIIFLSMKMENPSYTASLSKSLEIPKNLQGSHRAQWYLGNFLLLLPFSQSEKGVSADNMGYCSCCQFPSLLFCLVRRKISEKVSIYKQYFYFPFRPHQDSHIDIIEHEIAKTWIKQHL